jgi:phosphoenolpyruvate carboxylase
MKQLVYGILRMCFTVLQGYGSLPTEKCNGESIENALIKLGFWPGGDRDGNPLSLILL